MSRDGYLPPGVETWMIPGDRPQDDAWERAWEEIAQEFREAFEKGKESVILFDVEEAIDALMNTTFGEKLVEKRTEENAEAPERERDE